MDRTHRIGQLQAVNVYRIVTQNSIEEKIMKLQEKKIAMSDAIINTDNSTLFSMGTDRLLDVFTFDTVDDNLNTSELNNDFDGLLDSCGDDYASLSVAHFTRSLD